MQKKLPVLRDTRNTVHCDGPSLLFSVCVFVCVRACVRACVCVHFLFSSSFIQYCFTSTETVGTVRDREPRMSTLTFPQLLNSDRKSDLNK